MLLEGQFKFLPPTARIPERLQLTYYNALCHSRTTWSLENNPLSKGAAGSKLIEGASASEEMLEMLFI